ncbi:hypothetical protein MK079_05310 [Candidatus Gracilibacteria bacterium]|nr:hypothetical protein [Candidatus Gracilibacteria bacterium]
MHLNSIKMFAFQLGREFKLSLAEIYALFPSAERVFESEQICILNKISKQDILDTAHKIGGTIKIIEVVSETDIQKCIVSQAIESEGKFHYGFSIFGNTKSPQTPFVKGGEGNLKKELLHIKKSLKKENISSRFVNKDFKNLSSAQIIGEKLVEKKTDFNIIFTPLLDKEGLGVVYLGKTIWIQDIESYSQRDWSKGRDMQVGMLPPKLSQMMINIASTNKFPSPSGGGVRGGGSIYDPFIGLGTVLIESLHMGNKRIYGSDLSDAMVSTSRENIQTFILLHLFALYLYRHLFPCSKAMLCHFTMFKQ